MKMRSLTKLAGGSAILALSAIGCTPSADIRPASFSAKASKQMSAAAKEAQVALARLSARDSAGAVPHAERAVELAPADVGYRAVLAQAYLGSGRFASAASAFQDVLTLDRRNGKAMLGLGLARTAQGQRMAALSALSGAEGLIAPTDLGLALALAGDPQRAVALLEPAARAPGATPKIRQNLALAYALAGRWDKAKGIASVDVPADQLQARMEMWASFADPAHASEQVASLLGVTPASDPGMPEKLALANLWAPQAAEVTIPLDAPAPAPSATARAMPVAPQPAPVVAQPAAAAAAPAQLATTAQPLEVAPERAIPYAAPTAPVEAPLVRPRLLRTAATEPAAVAPFVARPFVRQQSAGRFVVQLGAFRQQARVEVAWDSFSTRIARIAGYTPSRATFRTASATLHRLSIAGITRREDAVKLCGMVREAGGTCFVREAAGDAPMQWARRKMNEQLASAS